MKNIDLVTLSKAAETVNKTVSNIRYYIQYNRIKKYNIIGEEIKGNAKNGELRVSLKELKNFLKLVKRGEGIHHNSSLEYKLGFFDVPERERTKHVHRLHPYLGKYIPQLVEWFLKKYFQENDVILDPFMGSGTTLVQGNELKIHTIGIEISEFNCMIAKAKTQKYNIEKVNYEIIRAKTLLSDFSSNFTDKNNLCINEFGELCDNLLKSVDSPYLKNWFAKRTLLEMIFYNELISNFNYKNLLKVLLCRSTRSCRLITHFDLARPKEPLKENQKYWCHKHNRECRPIGELYKKIHNYSLDTIKRLEIFDGLRSNKKIDIIQGDSRKKKISGLLTKQYGIDKCVDGIFTSPPYVGQIDYHDQHKYAYELLDIDNYEDKEIGPGKAGKSQKARVDYVNNISAVFKNFNKYLKDDAKIFIVANDKFNLYPEIAEKSNLIIKDKFHRAVTKRTEQGNNPYQETIFYMKKREE